MRKTLLLLFSLSLIAIGFIACGSSSDNGGGGNNQPSISVSPTSANILVGQSTNLTANVQNVSDTHVSWTLQEAEGGTITVTNSGAIYTAPWPVGTYHVVVTSVGNPSLTATATINVSAAFAFIQEYPAGDATPFSMTPQLGIYDPSGALTISGYTDQGTGNPVSVAMEAVALSPDGTQATFDIATPDSTWDIYTVNADGSGTPTQLTIDGDSWFPEFSADGQQIVYIRGSEIWAMNANGTNQHLVYTPTYYAYQATFSQDGAKIASEMEWDFNGDYYDGIAIMNTDGTNAVPLTGGADFPCAYGWDQMPAFTHDGTQILFSRYCDDNFTESLYIINTDGTGLTALYPAVGTPGVFYSNPVPVGDKILFQTNQDLPSAYPPLPFEIYSMKPDGTALTRLTNNTVYDAFDDIWYFALSSAASQQTPQMAAKRPVHGFAGRAARIQRQQQLRRRH